MATPNAMPTKIRKAPRPQRKPRTIRNTQMRDQLAALNLNQEGK